MRENPFYVCFTQCWRKATYFAIGQMQVDTIRAFRDRRNEYKAHTKKWANAKKKATDPIDKVYIFSWVKKDNSLGE